ncbi:hypothetical protein [Micromonospora sp. WMMD1082]|uniref:hypothetical protein n=1 Tax=Micromonospora sp. WMMD1082 TaxID=3016104 RepID=UPI00241795ED|nr:hypothetical protein [Micromonospora sp. WMMD1082]MDG4796877.1 hypothetical protein [Micromonospora sp. WMMD1082]
MRKNELTDTVVVSMQDRRLGATPVEGHLATGVLGDSGTVVVPAAPARLFDPGVELEALVIPLPLAVHRPIERLDARCLNAHRVGGVDGDAPLAVITLDRPSRHPATLGRFDGPTLARTLDELSGDVWTAFERLGMVEPGLRDGLPAQVWDRLAEVEREQRRTRLRNHRYGTPGDIGFSLCRILCICEPG